MTQVQHYMAQLNVAQHNLTQRNTTLNAAQHNLTTQHDTGTAQHGTT